LLSENPRASRFGECVPLQGKILVNGRNAGVADQEKRSLSQVNVEPHLARNPRCVLGEDLKLMILPLVTV
jgi:hypothetical protein